MYRLLELNPQLQDFSGDIDYRMQLYRDTKQRLLSVFQNRIESRPIRRRSLPDTGRLRWRFSFFCASLFQLYIHHPDHIILHQL